MNENLLKTLFQCLLSNLMQIDSAEDSFIDPDFSVELMESTANLLQKLNKEEISILMKILEKLINEKEYLYNKEYLELFLENFGLIK